MPDAVASQEDAIRAWLNSTSAPDADVSFDRLQGLNPDISRIQAAASSAPSRLESFKAKNQVPGTPLDVTTGAPAIDTMWSSFRTDPEQVIKYWQDKYGKDNVRLSTSGVPIVRALNEKTGKPEDILVNPETISAKDLTKLVGTVPEIAGAILLDKGVGLIPKLSEASGIFKVARQAAAQAVGAEASGAMKDVAVRTIDQQPIPLDVFLNRAKNVPMDFAANLGLAGVGKAVSKVISPFGGELPPIQQDAQAGLARLRERYGETIPQTIGQKTGVPFFQRTEEEMKRLPGGAWGLYDIRDRANAAIQRVMNRLQGLPVDADEAARAAQPTTEEIGRRAISTLQSSAEPLESAWKGAKQSVLDESHREILDQMTQATIPERQLYMTKVGQAIRDKVEMARNDFQDTSSALYRHAMTLPGGQDRILSAPSLASRAKSALESLPSKAVITETPTGILDEFGNPYTRTTTGREVMKEFVPSNVVGKLQELSTSGNEKFSLQDLISMRNEVTNDIKAGEAIPGVQTHHLSNIRDMLTQSIKESTDAIPDKQLRNAWQAANDFYAGNVKKFHTAGIASILKEAEAPGSVGNAQIVQRLTGESPRATDFFLDMKNFLGPNSVQFKMIKRSIADSIYETSKDAGTDTLNAKTFIKQMTDLRNNQREVFDEVFGSRGHGIVEQAKYIGLANADKIGTDDIERLLNDPNASRSMRGLIAAQKAKDELFQNTIMKAVGSKTLPKEGIEAGDFVNRFASSANPTDVKKAMDLIESQNPDLAQAIRFRTVQQVLNDAGRNMNATDRVAFRLDPQRVVGAQKLAEIMKSPRGQTIETIIGKDAVDDLKAVAQSIRPQESTSAAFASAGGISGGMAIRQFWTGGIGGFINKTLRNTLGAAIESAPPLRAYVGNQVMTPERTAGLMTTAMASRPIAQELVKDYGIKGSMQAADHIMTGLQNSVNQLQSPKTNSTNAIIQWLNQ